MNTKNYPCFQRLKNGTKVIVNHLWLTIHSSDVEEILIIDRGDSFQFCAYLLDESSFTTGFDTLQEALTYSNLFDVPVNINFAWENKIISLKHFEMSGRA